MNFDKLWFPWAMEISSNLALYLKMLVLVTAIAVSICQSACMKKCTICRVANRAQHVVRDSVAIS